MKEGTKAGSVLGCAGLLALCNRLPIHRLSWRMDTSHWASIMEKEGQLRHRLWRSHCAASASAGTAKCRDVGLACKIPGSCLADRWLPLPASSRNASWRMANLFVRAYPDSGELALWVIGELSDTERASLVLDMHPWVGERQNDYRHASLSNFSPKIAGRYRMKLITPWVLEKIAPHRQPRTVDNFALRLRESLERRMQKFASLATRHAIGSGQEDIETLLGFTARYVAQHLLPGGLELEASSIEPSAFGIPSGSNGRLVPHVVANAGGTATLHISEQALPWMGLLVIAGGGESPDKGFGGIELSPV